MRQQDRHTRVIAGGIGFTAMWLLLASVGTTSVAAGGLTYDSFHGGAPDSDLKTATAAAVSPDDRHVYVAARTSDALTAWERDALGTLVGPVDVEIDGVNGVDGLRRPAAVAIDPEGKNVYVAGDADDAVVVFARDAFLGALDYLEHHRQGLMGVSGIGGPESVVVSPDGAHVYVGGKQSSSVAVFTRDAATGRLVFVDAAKNGIGGVRCLQEPRQILLSPDGLFLYATAEDGPSEIGSIAVFARDAVSGGLAFVDCAQNNVAGVTGMKFPGGLTVSADGRHLYVASRGGDAVLAFRRDVATGRLGFVSAIHDGGVVSGLATPAGIASDAAGAYVYVTSHSEGALAVFRRNPATGALAFLESQHPYDPVFADVLQSANGVVVPADGRNVYVTTGTWHGGIAGFTVDRCGSGQRGPDEQCDDGNDVSGDGCSDTCRLELCPPAPRSGCRKAVQPGAASLVIDNDPSASDVADLLRWKWNKGEATLAADFGDPTNAADLSICLYDGSALPQPLASYAAPAGGTCFGRACWKRGSTSFSYNDRLLTPDGVRSVRLKQGIADGQARIQVMAQGLNLGLPSLPLDLPVTVEVTNGETGVCWQATYGTAVRNDAGRFGARSD